MVCLGFEPRASGLEAQTNPLRYGRIMGCEPMTSANEVAAIWPH